MHIEIQKSILKLIEGLSVMEAEYVLDSIKAKLEVNSVVKVRS